jgi:PmbA protein
VSDDGLLALARSAVGAARPGEELEAYAARHRTTQIEAYQGAVERLTSAETQGLGVRVITDGRLGYAWAADPGLDDVGGLVDQARANAASAAPWEGNVLPDAEPIPPLEGVYLPDIETTPPTEKVRLALDAERMTKESDARVRAVPQAAYGESVGHEAVASTKGVEALGVAGACWSVAVALAGEGDETQTGWSIGFARRAGDLDVEGMAREASDRACRLLGARKPKTERLPVIFDPWTAADLLGILAAALNAESVLKGRSLFIGKTGETVASDVFTLTDDGRDVRGAGATPFDAEGLPTRRTPVIEGGVLKGFLHNASTAARMGTRSTGNALRGGYKSTPGVGPNVFVLAPGDDPPEKLLARAGRGLYVQDLEGVHSGVNPISGDFSVGVTGLMVEGGALAQPVREATVASTLLDILNSIEAVGSDLRYLPTGGVAAPTVLIGEMTVSGT